MERIKKWLAERRRFRRMRKLSKLYRKQGIKHPHLRAYWETRE